MPPGREPSPPRPAWASPASRSFRPRRTHTQMGRCAILTPMTVYLVGAGPGDPGLITVRGAEVLAALRAAGVPVEIVPGITSAVAVPAYAGVPVTHRGLASTFTIVTGQEGEAGVPVDWEAVARLGGTIAVLMGVAKRGEIADRLMAGGLPADTPVAAVTWGTRPEQRTHRTTLGSLGGAPVESPAVLVIGAVATLHLPWYEDRPLFGKRVIVT